jgi:hypothetical protein
MTGIEKQSPSPAVIFIILHAERNLMQPVFTSKECIVAKWIVAL